jgi:hypothetical protein
MTGDAAVTVTVSSAPAGYGHCHSELGGPPHLYPDVLPPDGGEAWKRKSHRVNAYRQILETIETHFVGDGDGGVTDPGRAFAFHGDPDQDCARLVPDDAANSSLSDLRLCYSRGQDKREDQAKTEAGSQHGCALLSLKGLMRFPSIQIFIHYLRIYTIWALLSNEFQRGWGQA